MRIGDSSQVSELDQVITVGYPLAETIGYGLSAYQGTVNAIRQTRYVTLLQIDANVNPGNSGGPVLNDRGEVIGIVVAKLNALELAQMTGSIPERINFAISIDDAKPIMASAYPEGYVPSDTSNVVTPKEIFSAAKNAVILIFSQTADIPTPVSRKDYVAPTNLEAKALIERLFEAENSANADEAVACFASQTYYFNLGWVHPNAIRLDLLHDWNEWSAIHSDKLEHVDRLTRGKANSNGQPAWVLNFTEEITEGTTGMVAAGESPLSSEAVRRTILVRQNGKLLFQEWQ